MRIDKLEVGSLSGTKLRDLFKRRDFLALVDVEKKTGRKAAPKAWAALLDGGYVAPADEFGRHEVTDLGRRVGKALITPRISRAVAEKAINSFVARCHELETRDALLYRVKVAVVFGSCLTAAADLGDVDIAIELVPKSMSHDEWVAARRAQIDQGKAEARVFQTHMDALEFPERSVWVFLKNRSRHLDLVRTDDGVLATAEQSVIYGSR